MNDEELTSAIVSAAKAEIWAVNIVDPSGKTVYSLKWDENKLGSIIQVFGIPPETSFVEALLYQVRESLKRIEGKKK